MFSTRQHRASLFGSLFLSFGSLDPVPLFRIFEQASDLSRRARYLSIITFRSLPQHSAEEAVLSADSEALKEARDSSPKTFRAFRPVAHCSIGSSEVHSFRCRPQVLMSPPQIKAPLTTIGSHLRSFGSQFVAMHDVLDDLEGTLALTVFEAWDLSPPSFSVFTSPLDALTPSRRSLSRFFSQSKMSFVQRALVRKPGPRTRAPRQSFSRVHSPGVSALTARRFSSPRAYPSR